MEFGLSIYDRYRATVGIECSPVFYPGFRNRNRIFSLQKKKINEPLLTYICLHAVVMTPPKIFTHRKSERTVENPSPAAPQSRNPITVCISPLPPPRLLRHRTNSHDQKGTRPTHLFRIRAPPLYLCHRFKNPRTVLPSHMLGGRVPSGG